MTTANPLRTIVNGDVTQTTYELSEPITYERWNGEKRKTMYVVVSHTRYNGLDETAVFPGTLDGKIPSYLDLYMSSPMCDDATALSALGMTIIDPVI